MIGERIGEFEIVERIGEGGMATVYKAHQPSVDRHVAIKILPRQVSEDPSFLKRFQHEARVIARLEHRSILPIYAYGEHDGIPYIAMRLLEHGTLRKKMFYDPLSLVDVARIVEQVGEALDYAHAHGVIHRDLKPSNILLDENNNAYLTDFGIAKMLNSTEQITADGVVGTPNYMSPEQCQGKSALPASDLYALGAILYEMVTGEPPFMADTPLAVMYMQVKEPVPSVLEVNADLPGLIDRVILKAMAKNPAARFETGAALAAAFKRAVGMRPAADAPSERAGAATGPEMRAQKRAEIKERAARREEERIAEAETHPVRRILLIGILAAMVAAGVWVTVRLTGIGLRGNGRIEPTFTPPAQAAALTPEEAATVVPGDLIDPTQPGVEPTLTSLPPTPSAAPATPTVVVDAPEAAGVGRLVYTEGANQTAEIMVLDLASGQRTALTDNGSYDGEPDWSPDGTLIVFESSRTGNYDLHVMDSSGGNVRQLTNSPQRDRHADWSPDGVRIVYESGIGNSSEIYVRQADGSGQPIQLTANGFGDRAPQFSSDGTQIAYMTEERGRWEIAIMGFPEGERTALFDCPDADCRFPTWSPMGDTIAFNTLDASGQVADIYTVNVETGEATLVVDDGQNGRPVYSEDGRTVYFNRTVDNISGIYRLEVSSGEVFRVTDQDVDEYAADWGN